MLPPYGKLQFTEVKNGKAGVGSGALWGKLLVVRRLGQEGPREMTRPEPVLGDMAGD